MIPTINLSISCKIVTKLGKAQNRINMSLLNRSSRNSLLFNLYFLILQFLAVLWKLCLNKNRDINLGFILFCFFLYWLHTLELYRVLYDCFLKLRFSDFCFIRFEYFFYIFVFFDEFLILTSALSRSACPYKAGHFLENFDSSKMC